MRRQDSEIEPSWTVFDQSLSSEEREHTAVGYLPTILAPAHEFDTLNTIVKRCLAISSRFGQEHTVITVDQALYYRLMELKWSLPQYQDKLIPRLGGLPVSMNFLKAIGDHIYGSGLADVWGRLDCLGRRCRTCSGRKGIRQSYESTQTDSASPLASPDAKPPLICCRGGRGLSCLYFKMAADDDSQTIPKLITFLDQDKFRKLLAGFVESRSDVVNFSFWWQYMDMVAILLQYTRAQRDGIWELHLYSFSLMLPYFKRYDHLTYARWGPVYLVEMHQLPGPVLSEFKRGNFVVKRSAHKISQVDP